MSSAEAYKRKLEEKYGKKSGSSILLRGEQVFQGHEKRVTCLSFSPDDTVIASGSWDATIRLWGIDSGSRYLLKDSGMSTLHGLAISPRGTHLISGSEDNMIRIWDLQTRKVCHTVWPTDQYSLGNRAYPGPFNPYGHAGTVICLAYSPAGDRFVSGSYDRMLKMWGADGKHQYTVPPVHGWQSSSDLGWKAYNGPLDPQGHEGSVDCVRFSRTGSKVVSASFDKAIRVWGANTGRPLLAIDPAVPFFFSPNRVNPDGHTEAVNSAVFSPDESQIVSGSDDYTVRVWDAVSGDKRFVILPSEGPSTFTSSNPHIPYDGPTNRHGHSSKVLCVDYSPLGDFFVSGSEDRTLRAWDPVSFENIFIQEFKSPISCVALSNKGSRLAVGLYDSTVRVFEVERS